jgi:hypothetical protein
MPNYKSHDETVEKIRYQLEIESDDVKFNNLMKASLVGTYKVL